MKNHSFIMYLYLILAILGIVLPWYYNIQYIMDGNTLTFQAMWKHGMATSLSSSLTVDLLIGVTAFEIFMIAEAIRLKMKWYGIYIVFTFLIAFAFACPFFLYMRERKIKNQKLY